MVRVAIVGSREYPDWHQVYQYVETLPADAVVISGGARGVDRVAVEYARRRRLITEVYPADWETHGKSAGFIRNQTIVERADQIVAFWDGTSKGTADTIRRARAAGKPIMVIGPPATLPLLVGG